MLPKGFLPVLPLLFVNFNLAWSQQVILEDATPSLRFQLRHLHAAVPDNSRSLFANVNPERSLASLDSELEQMLHTNSLMVHKPRFRNGERTERELKVEGWNFQPVLAPNISDRKTLYELSKMTHNAYFEPSDKEWYGIEGNWMNFPFGWEPQSSGFRGHVFVSTDNSTVILTIKGTSLVVGPGTGGPTGKEDKLNDNLLFSCCCAHIAWNWKPVCDCYSGRRTCETKCLEDSLAEKSLFHNIGVNLYNNLTALYPNSDIWIIGHSLGGAIASLLGATFGAPVVTFEAPGEALAAQRLHLPSPPSTHHITHFMHNADPIAMGTCNGPLSPCALVGYAMETRCHLGQIILLDTVNELKWGVDFRTHPIKVIVDRLLGPKSEWFGPDEEESLKGDIEGRAWGRNKPGKKRALPKPQLEDEDCMASECFSWDFV